MGHSYIDFKDRWRMMNDAHIVIVVHVVLDEIRQHPDAVQLSEGVKALVDSWNTFIDVYGPGCLKIDFNEFVRTEADRISLLGVLNFARDSLLRFGDLIPGEYLNRIVDAPAILEFGDLPTSKVQAAFDNFIELLTEK
jgi:hypothetical protein